MANLISAQTGNFTTAATWQTVNAASELDSEANNSPVSTSNLDSSTFVPTAVTVDGVALKLAARAASPTGTFTVTLRDSTTSTNVDSVTVNVSDLPADGLGWVFFKFGSTHLLSNTDSYLIRVVCSNTGSQVTLYRNSTVNNWSRKLRTTTTQAPASGSHLVISNQFTGAGASTAVTVTMDNTATTSFGPTVSGGPPEGIVVSGNGTLTWGVTASTAYYLKWKGIFQICGGGTVNVGTSGARMPLTSSAVLEMDTVAGGDSKIRVDPGGTFNTYGGVVDDQVTLSASAAASQAVITVSSATGWQANDQVALNATASAGSVYERLTILTVSGTTITFTGNLGGAHAAGTAFVPGYALHMTRNIKIRSVSTTNRGQFLTAVGNGIAHCEYVEFDTSTLGFGSGVGQGGINIQTTTGTCTLLHCTGNPVLGSAVNNFLIQMDGTSMSGATVQHFNSWNTSAQISEVKVTNATSGTWTVDHYYAMCGTLASGAGSNRFDFTDCGGTFTNNIAFGTDSTNGSATVAFRESVNVTDSTLWAGNAIYAPTMNTANPGLLITASNAYVYFKNWTVRGGGATLAVSVASSTTYKKVILDSWDVDGAQIGISSACTIIMYGLFLSGATTAGFTVLNSGKFSVQLYLYDVLFGASGGGTRVDNAADFSLTLATNCSAKIYANDCSFSSTIFASAELTTDYQRALGDHLDGGSFLRCERYGQTTGDHRTFAPQGTIQTDSTVFHTAAPSAKMTPNSASFKLRSGPQEASITNATNRTVSVWVRRSKAASGDSADYNGNQPRLIARRNDAIGLAVDTVLATGSAAIGTWEQLSGTVTSPTDDGGVEVYVDCDGTAGFINVDDYAIS